MLKLRRREQEQWFQKILLLKGEIQYGQTSLPELCQKLGQKNGTRVDTFFYCMGERLYVSRGEVPFYAIWQEEIQPLVQELRLEQEPLLQLGSYLGSLNRQTEIGNLERYIEILRRQLKGEQEDFENRLKMVQALSLSAGMVLAILLL